MAEKGLAWPQREKNMAKIRETSQNTRKVRPAPVPRPIIPGRPTVLYKYASLDKPQYFFDTLVNHHLYAGLFSEMNDPMEGTFQTTEKLGQDVKDFFSRGKSMLRFCALSPSPYRTLMWSYYAKEHKGYCLEINVEKFDSNALVKMNYNNEIPKNIAPNDESIKQLLCRKFTDWAHEEEWRLFVEDGKKYIEDVTIKTIYFGINMKDEDFQLYKGIINIICPEIEVKKMKKALLNENHIDTSDKLTQD